MTDTSTALERVEAQDLAHRSRIVNLIKRLALEVAEMKGSYLDIFHADRIRWLGTLAAVTNLAA